MLAVENVALSKLANTRGKSWTRVDGKIVSEKDQRPRGKFLAAGNFFFVSSTIEACVAAGRGSALSRRLRHGHWGNIMGTVE